MTRLFLLLALMVMIAATWAALVTLFSPPLTLDWREFSDAMGRRSFRNVAVPGVGPVLALVLPLLFLALQVVPGWALPSPPSCVGRWHSASMLLLKLARLLHDLCW